MFIVSGWHPIRKRHRFIGRMNQSHVLARVHRRASGPWPILPTLDYVLWPSTPSSAAYCNRRNWQITINITVFGNSSLTALRLVSWSNNPRFFRIAIGQKNPFPCSPPSSGVLTDLRFLFKIHFEVSPGWESSSFFLNPFFHNPNPNRDY